MLESLMMSTRVCNLLVKRLGLEIFRRAHDLYGTDTPKKNILVVGDLDPKFNRVFSVYAATATVVHSIPFLSVGERTTHSLTGYRTLQGLDQIAHLDSNQFDAALVIEPSVIGTAKLRRELQRVLVGQSRLVFWLSSVSVNPLTDEVCSELGFDKIVATDYLSDFDHPGNTLHTFDLRSDKSTLRKR